MPTLAEDRAAISDVLACYCHNFDSGNADGVADLFTEDGVFDPGVAGFDPVEGREAIREFVGSMPAGMVHHMTTDAAYDVAGDVATASRRSSWWRRVPSSLWAVTTTTSARRRGLAYPPPGRGRRRDGLTLRRSTRARTSLRRPRHRCHRRRRRSWSSLRAAPRGARRRCRDRRLRREPRG